MHSRPDKPLVVKCTYERANKRITFTSARNCTYDLLKHKVEQCFSLYASTYAIAYKDDDGEETNIETDYDLTEAIQYFQAGSDDPPISSAASILSGRSFGPRKITLRVHINVEYDGPSLSDTSSLVSLDDYKGRNSSQFSLSFSSSPSAEVDDDSITVSSKDMGSSPWTNIPPPSKSPKPSGRYISSPAGPSSREIQEDGTQSLDPYQAAVSRFPENPSLMLEHPDPDAASQDAVFSDHSPSLAGEDRGSAWLRDQKERVITSMLGALPEPSESDGSRVRDIDDRLSQMSGDLSLRRNPRGKFYYSYTSGGSTVTSQTRESGYEDRSVYDEVQSSTDEVEREVKPRPTSMQLNWLASQRIPVASSSISGRAVPRLPITHPLPEYDPPLGYDDYHGVEIPPEVLPFISLTGPPPSQLTTCSECGVDLDSIRYVCSSCGEKKHSYQSDKGKCTVASGDTMTYPPPRQFTSSARDHYQKPLPSLPNGQRSIIVPESDFNEQGYELCSGCIESAGVIHALESSVASSPLSSRGSSSPVSPQDAQSLSQRRRAAPAKGKLRHGYFEKIWGHKGWVDVELDNMYSCICSTCSTVIINQRYKCASCKNFNLCRACYSQVHEIHPSHAFLVVPDKMSRPRSESDSSMTLVAYDHDEQSLKHLGVQCTHCMQDIVGARFHCAVCESIDICSNCESVGLPGNLDSSDGGHSSSHIMIKIPYPLESVEVKTASRRAISLWTDRDAATVQRASSSPGSVISSYAQTVVGGDSSGHLLDSSPNGYNVDDHHMACDGCAKPIIGVRYQCASCPSSAKSYSLCSWCEERSYIIHDPMHIFIKLPRPVHRPLESAFPLVPKLYKMPVGPPPSLGPPADPRSYLKDVLHQIALCDRCMTQIRGEWFRCAYCSKDLCDDCEALDTHDDTHVFIVFKAPVEMQYFRHFADLENTSSPPVIQYPIYR